MSKQTEGAIFGIIALAIGVWNLKVGFESDGALYCLAWISVIGFLATIFPVIIWFLVRPRFENVFGVTVMVTVGTGLLASLLLLIGNIYCNWIPGGSGGPLHYMPRL
jgi:hypothetical protein